MKDDDKVTDLNMFNDFLNQLEIIGGGIKDNEKCISLLCSLMNYWENLIFSINKATKVENLKLDEIVDQFL